MEKYCELQMSIKRSAGERDCPLISKLSEGARFYYTVARDEMTNGENHLLLTTLVNLFAGERYHDAISLLSLTFSLIGIDAASEIVAAVGAADDYGCEETFLAKFLMECAEDLNDALGAGDC